MTDLHTRLSSARTLLFVPGDRPERFPKAVASGADLIIVDLEDAVPPDRKEAALEHTCTWLADGHAAIVRINGVGTPSHESEVESLRGLGEFGVMLPKAESAEAVQDVVRAFDGVPLVALVETALGIERTLEVCSVDGVARAAFGSVDLAAQLGVDHSVSEALAWARSRLVNACAATGMPGPIDGVTTAVGDKHKLREDLRVGRLLGFTGKLCIHPQQVTLARDALSASPKEIALARRTVEAVADQGVAVLDGQMIDAPVAARAMRILDQAAANGAGRLL